VAAKKVTKNSDNPPAAFSSSRKAASELSPRDQPFIDVWANGVETAEGFVKALGLEQLPHKEQVEYVAKTKDRLRKYLVRKCRYQEGELNLSQQSKRSSLCFLCVLL
jgi:hypothetical protein